ncbi:hypothetical protein [Leucobacter tenebrionis]|uniref:hypothetical protein n=1 Tax=Leucobacter tenebrionis TaxID=2873270 RepID=UPI001CA79470|nr:hypothetical protein [Leucobacter tenebrionis]QZY52392.1 hypothetical protein KVY00_02685 [Leucobacter tenebrionis]
MNDATTEDWSSNTEEFTRDASAAAWHLYEIAGGDVAAGKQQGPFACADRIDQSLRDLPPFQSLPDRHRAELLWHLISFLAEVMRERWDCRWTWAAHPDDSGRETWLLTGWRAMPGTRPRDIDPALVVSAEMQQPAPSFWRMINTAEELAEVRVFRAENL